MNDAIEIEAYYWGLSILPALHSGIDFGKRMVRMVDVITSGGSASQPSQYYDSLIQFLVLWGSQP